MPRYRIKLVPQGLSPRDSEHGIHLTPEAPEGSEGDCRIRFNGLVVNPTVDAPYPGDITYRFTWQAGTEFCDRCVEVTGPVSSLDPDPTTDLSVTINCNDKAAQYVDIVVPAAAVAISDWNWSVLFHVAGLVYFGEHAQTYCVTTNNSNTLDFGDPFTAGFGPGLWQIEVSVDGTLCETGIGDYGTGMHWEILLNGSTPVTFGIPAPPSSGGGSILIWTLNLDVSGTSPGDVITAQPIVESTLAPFGSPVTINGV